MFAYTYFHRVAYYYTRTQIREGNIPSQLNFNDFLINFSQDVYFLVDSRVPSGHRDRAMVPFDYIIFAQYSQSAM